ncbi:MAG: PAS domain-containing sensor histidine kinase, partial [Armatimonadetes bacterium]|nr:PAS domain-containing sensor histidine kinase [Armatimonadota bacterium]
IVGKHFSLFYSPEDIQAGKPEAALKRAAAEGRWEEEGWRVRRDGSRFWANMILTALHDSEGNLRGFCHVARDISGRKTLEDTLRERTEQLEKANRNKNTFISTLSHELRSPLSVLTNVLFLLKKRDLGERENRSVEAAEHQVTVIARLVDDLTDISRIARGKIELSLQKVSLSRVADRVAQDRAILFQKRNQEFTVHLVPDLLNIEADSVRVEQILYNLLTNASKYTPEGGKIELSVLRDGADAILRVRDSGYGIEASMLPHIFDLYSQVDSSARQSQNGLGIGLYLVHRLVSLHGGNITVRSEGKDRGSEFEVRLPLIDATAAPSHRTEPPLHAPSDVKTGG